MERAEDLDGHPSPGRLDVDEPDAAVREHLAGCAKCRIDQRMLRRSRQAQADAPGHSVARPALTHAPETGSPSLLTSWAPAPPSGPAPLSAGERIGRFEVIRLLGRGGMGEVYLARDTQLGRKVALKLVRIEVLARADFRERFLREARLTARFSHPHIVTTYEVGEYEGRPWLALEFLDGESLRERLAAEEMAPRQAARFGLAVARALEEAHAHGVVHRDLKPENILLPTNGRLRVVDFGLARPVEATEDTQFHSTVGQIVGTPAYMAPEQWASAPATPAADVWALGLVLYEMLAGTRPFASVAIPALMAEVVDPTPVRRLLTVPADLADLVARCLEKDASKRPTATEAADALERHLEGRRAGPTEEVSPFRGLLPFDERHGALFVGRDAEIDGLVERLRDETVLPVVGPSGAGKSSLVAAGVVPRLREQGRWVLFRVRPGAHPFEALVARIERGPLGSTASTVDPPAPEAPFGPDLAARLERSPELLAWVLQKAAERHDAKVLLFVDQFEELYTLVEDAAVRQAFARAICGAADDPEGPVRVVFTVRDDFLVRLAETPEARRVLARLAVVRSPGPVELREILVEPVSRAGYRYEDDALVEQMIDAVQGEPACLPLIQFAGAQLWERRDTTNKVLTRDAYRAMGGVEGSLARHADAVVDAMSPTQARAARSLLLRLVTAEGTRRVTTRRQVLEGLPADAEVALAALVDGRTLLVGRGKGGDEGEARVELAHESLVQRWERLAGWLAEGRSEIAFLREAEQAAALWVARGRHEAEVWSGEALWEARRKAERVESVPVDVAGFLEAGARREARVRVRRRRAVGIGMGLLALVAIGAVGAAVRIGNEKEQGDAHRAAALLATAFGERAAGRNLEARAYLREAFELRDTVGARALWWQILQDPLGWKVKLEGSISALEASPDDRTIAVASGESVYLVDTRSGGLRVLRGHSMLVEDVAWSRSGRWLASTGYRGDVRVWDLEAGTSIELGSPREDEPTGLAFGANDATLAVSAKNGIVRLWDVRTASLREQLDAPEGGVQSMAYSPDGATLATGGIDGSVRFWNAAGGMPWRVVATQESSITALAWSQDGSRLATGGLGVVKLWDAATGALIHTLTGHASRVQGVVFDTTGKVVASVGSDGTLRVWDPVGGRSLAVHRAGGALLFDVDVAAGGLVTGDLDGVLRFWNAGATAADASDRAVGGHTSDVSSVAFSPDGGRLATASFDRTARVWDRTSGRSVTTLSGHEGPVIHASFLPDGEGMVTSAWDHTLRVWDLASATQVGSLFSRVEFLGYHAVRPDGRFVAAGANNGDIRIWDVTGEAAPRLLAGARRFTSVVDYSPDGTRLVSGGRDGVVRLWDAVDGRLIGALPHGEVVRGVRFQADGRSVFTASEEGLLRHWDLGTMAARELARVEGPLAWVDVFPDGRRVAVAAEEGGVSLVDVASGVQTLLARHPKLSNLAVSPSGDAVAASSTDGSVRLWDVTTGRPAWRGPLLRSKEGELYTHQGWLSAATGDALSPPPAAWRRAVEADARLAAESTDGTHLCLATFSGALETWDLAEDRVVSRHPLAGITDLRALPGACVVLAEGKASLHARDGTITALRSDVTALDVTGDEVLVAAGGEVVAFGSDGRERTRWKTDIRVTAVGRVGGRIGVGYREGTIDLLPAGDGAGGPAVGFDTGVSAAVTRILAGPEGTFAAGFTNGSVGLWSVETGTRLYTGLLHGAVEHLAPVGGVLVAATGLGQRLGVDLAVFDEDYCTLLRSVWAEMPVTVRDGRLEETEPPAGHRCRTE